MNHSIFVKARLAGVLAITASAPGCTFHAVGGTAPAQPAPAAQPVAAQPAQPVAEQPAPEPAPAPAEPPAADPVPPDQVLASPSNANETLPPIPGVYKNFKQRQALVCGNGENIAIRNAVIDTANVGILAQGNCKVTIKKSFIRGRGIGVVARDTARVNIVDSRIIGRSGIAAQATGSGLVSARKSEFVGRADGHFDDRGQNQFIAFAPPPPVTHRGPAAPPPAPAVAEGDDLPPAYEGDMQPIPGVYKNFKTRDPLVCKGNDRVAVRNAIIDTRGVAVIARGNCKVTIKKSFVRGRRIGIVTYGKARVNVVDSRIAGWAGIATRTHGASEVSARKSEFVGRRDGKFVDRGQNKFFDPRPPVRPQPPATRPAPPPPAAPAPPPPAQDELEPIPGVYKNFKTRAPLVCKGNDNIAIRNAIIDTANVAVMARGNCRVTIKKSYIRGRNVGIVAEGHARVNVVDSYVVGRRGGATQTRGGAVVSARASELVGGTRGNFDDRGQNKVREVRHPRGHRGRHHRGR